MIPTAAEPIVPMLAKAVADVPEPDSVEGGLVYEPKWDGFRGLLENGTGELRLWSRNARPLLRYFPELRPLGELLPPRSALDGEIVIVRDGVLDFDAMQTRLHPAESRVNRLAGEIPATFVTFDVLVWDDRVIRTPELEVPHPRLAERRFALQPLVDVLGEDFVIPTVGRAGDALDRVRDQAVELIADRW